MYKSVYTSYDNRYIRVMKKEFIPHINRLFILLKLDNYYLFAHDLNAKHTN